MDQDRPSYRIVKMKDTEAYPQEARKTSKPKAINASLYSPANLHVYDARGNHVGVIDANSVDRGIANSFYFSHKAVPEEVKEKFPEEVIIFEPNDNYVYRVIGKEKGKYRLVLTSTENDIDTVFEANSIPTAPGAVHQYFVDWERVAAGEDGVIVDIDADGDGNFERSIVADSELTAAEFDQPPVAEAGADQTVHAWIDGLADVTLDGSDSNDPDGDPLTYRWTWMIDGTLWEVDGVSPTITLPVGSHTITLVVNDGLMDSAPDDVNVTVIAPLVCTAKVTPVVVNRKSNQPDVQGILELPTGISKEQVDLDQKLILYPGGIEAMVSRIVGSSTGGGKSGVAIHASFSKSSLMAAVPTDGPIEVDIVGRLETGQWFSGRAPLLIMTPPR